MGKTHGSARAEWNQLLQTKKEELGSNSVAAAVALDRERPGLRKKMIQEANKPNESNLYDDVPPSSKSQWDNLVAEKTAQLGCRSKAVRAVAKERPDLRRKLIKDFNRN